MGLVDERGKKLNGAFGFLWSILSQTRSVRAVVYTGTHTALQVSFLVMEALGEDGRLVSQAPVMNSQG